VIVGVVFLHLWALHHHKSNNPQGIDLSKADDYIPFHPYYTVKDVFGLGVYLIPFTFMVFFAPEYLGHPDNYIPANPLVTPAHIVPEWYFLPFYAILRAIPIKELGVLAMFGSILILFVLPWLDRSPVRSARFRPLYRPLLMVFFANFLFLGYLGAMPAEAPYTTLSLIATTIYFGFFAALPLLARIEKPKPIPLSI
jgi:quinol-cytochrome oxidoreductase complex cytochrome b subunit